MACELSELTSHWSTNGRVSRIVEKPLVNKQNAWALNLQFSFPRFYYEHVV